MALRAQHSFMCLQSRVPLHTVRWKCVQYCVRACVRARVCVCARARVCVRVRGGAEELRAIPRTCRGPARLAQRPAHSRRPSADNTERLSQTCIWVGRTRAFLTHTRSCGCEAEDTSLTDAYSSSSTAALLMPKSAPVTASSVHSASGARSVGVSVARVGASGVSFGLRLGADRRPLAFALSSSVGNAGASSGGGNAGASPGGEASSGVPGGVNSVAPMELGPGCKATMAGAGATAAGGTAGGGTAAGATTVGGAAAGLGIAVGCRPQPAQNRRARSCGWEQCGARAVRRV
jgi:hypothetical protein